MTKRRSKQPKRKTKSVTGKKVTSTKAKGRAVPKLLPPKKGKKALGSKLVAKPAVESAVADSSLKSTVVNNSATQPLRAPVRRVLGEKIVSVPPIQSPLQNGEPAVVKIVEAPKPSPTPLWADCVWDKLPEAFPLTVRALVALAQNECERAKQWPLSFARLMVRLPGLISGVEIGLLVLGGDYTNKEIAKILDRDEELIKNRIEDSREKMRAEFAQSCTTMSRQWSNVLGGAGADERSLIERYLVEELNIPFQKLLGKILLIALGAQNPIINSRRVLDRWTTNPINMGVEVGSMEIAPGR